MGNVLHDRASSSAHSLPVPIWAFIQEIVRQRRFWLSVLSVRMVFFTSCEVTKVLCKARSVAWESVKIFTNMPVGKKKMRKCLDCHLNGRYFSMEYRSKGGKAPSSFSYNSTLTIDNKACTSVQVSFTTIYEDIDLSKWRVCSWVETVKGDTISLETDEIMYTIHRGKG